MLEPRGEEAFAVVFDPDSSSDAADVSGETLSKLLRQFGLEGNVAYCESSARLEDACDLTKDGSFVGSKVQDAVADNAIDRSVHERKPVDSCELKLHILIASGLCIRLCPLDHGRSHVDSDHPSLWPYLLRCEKNIEATTGAESDIQQVTRIARGMVERWGMSEKVGFLTVAPQDGQSPLLPGADPVSEATQELIDAEVRRIVDDEMEATGQLLADNRDKLDSLAEALLERETLDEADAYAAAGIERGAVAAR